MIDLAQTRIVWIDVESDGLTPREGCSLLQVASIVTDGELNEISEAFEAKIRYTAEQVTVMRDNAVPFVRDMHDATNLWGALIAEGERASVVDFKLHRFLREAGVEENKSRLAGNSITLDREFLAAFLPKTYGHLFYRNYDMTSVAGFLELYRPEIPQFVKAKSHDALDDIRESIAEARHYRDALRRLVQPGSAGYYNAPLA